MGKKVDVVVVGLGPAGLMATIYALRYKLSTVVVGKQLGGELSLAHRVENLPGFKKISGAEWAEKVLEQVKELGAEVVTGEVGRIDKKEKGFRVEMTNGKVFEAGAVIVATGSERRRLGVPGEDEYLGRGVSYCTTCDGPFFKGRRVALIGGSDSAVSGAVHTAEYASKVYIVYRRDRLRAEPAWVEEWQRLEKEGKGETIYNTNVVEILGDGQKVTGVKLDNPYKGKEVLEVDGVFIEIGGVPGTALVEPMGVELDERGYVKVGEGMETKVAGLFCAGDMTSKSAEFKQAIWAMAQGARAAASAYRFLRQQAAPPQRGVCAPGSS